MDKSQARLWLKNQRSKLTKEEIYQISQDVISQISQDPHFIKSTHIGIYFPIQNEIDLTKLLTQYPHKIYLAPLVTKNQMKYVIINAHSKMKKSPLGVLEPISDKDHSTLIEYLLIPCLGVSATNYRLGYGRGYFDRFLSNKPNIIKVGIAYHFSLIDFNPESHDIKLDYIIKGELRDDC